MLKKKISILIVILSFLSSIFLFYPFNKEYKVVEVKSPTHLVLNGTEIIYKDLDCFDSNFTEKNLNLSKSLNISEEEAFLLGNLAKQWTESFMKNRRVMVKNKTDVIYNRLSYKENFLHSGFCIIDSKPYFKEKFDSRLKSIRKGNYKVYDLDSKTVYNPSDTRVRELKKFIVVRKSHLPKNKKDSSSLIIPKKFFTNNNLKVFLADSTVKLNPDRNCQTELCKEILENINNTKNSIDIAIYGYSKVPAIENALVKALSRGVKIRLVCDSNSKGENIYPDTNLIKTILPENMSDNVSSNSGYIMHNKFYIFDDKILITGSANLSHTDLSGFNTNSMISINSPQIAKVYKEEFEQMFSGKFHLEKISQGKQKVFIEKTPIEIYFSPQDKAIENGILPLIKNAKNYIYIPSFVLTNNFVVNELINAKNRGVEIKIILDALSASNTHSKHTILRKNDIKVKTENYAGKMHSKSILVDDKYTVIGSMNFSNSGENKNDENLLIIENSQMTKFYKNFFLYQWNKIDDKWLKFDPKAEGLDSIGSCSDGLDNDYDGLVDLADEACQLK